MSRPLSELSCQTRMFVMSLCLSDADLARLGVLAEHADCCVQSTTAARSALHRLCAQDDEIARTLADLLDLRHVDVIACVRAHESAELVVLARTRARHATGDQLVGWAWALATDARTEVALLGQRLMADVYVRGLQALAQEPARRVDTTHGDSARASRDEREQLDA